MDKAEALEEIRLSIEENRGAKLSGADLRRAELREADLSRADLRWAKLIGADLRGADLRKANLSWANLSEANLSEANLRWADLREANLSEADLSEADLRLAYLREADLSEADLSEADLFGADLRLADLRVSNLRLADLREADLSEADLSGADLNVSNLSGATGLVDSSDYVEELERDDRGFIVYKRIGSTNFEIPDKWEIAPGSVLCEVCNPCRTTAYGCGINFGTLDWCMNNYTDAALWKCRIRYEWAAGVVVPYKTDGKARCSRLELLEIIHV